MLSFNSFEALIYYQPIALPLIILILKLSEYPARLFYLEFIGTDFLHKVPLVRCVPRVHAYEICTP
jgi:hypothetical protein